MNVSSNINYFEEWLTTIIKPCCIVYSSQKAKDIISKNNLTPSEYLRPFGDFQDLPIPSPFNRNLINSFKLDFIDKEDFISIPKEKYHIYIKSILKHPDICPQWKANQLKYSYKTVEDIIKIQKHFAFPWCNAFEKAIFELLKCQKNEIYQQPLANVYVCSIHENPSIINELQKKENIPQLLQDNVYYLEPKAKLIFVLIDKSEQIEKEFKSKIKEFQNLFSKTHFIIFSEINTGNNVNNNNMWKSYKKYIDLYSPIQIKNNIKQQPNELSFSPQTPPQNIIKLNTLNTNINLTSTSPKLILYDEMEEEEEITYGKYISNEEIKYNKHLIFDFLTSYVLDCINVSVEKYVKEDTIIKNYRKKKRIFFYTKEEIVIIDNNSPYTLSIIELNAFYVGIIYFYFRSYDKAYEYFNSLMDRMKNKSLLYYHFLKEISLICKVLLHEMPSEKDNHYIELFQEYLENGDFIKSLRLLIIIIKQYEMKNNFDKTRILDDFINLYLKYLKKKNILCSENNSETFLFLVYCAMICEKKAIFSLIHLYPEFINKRKFALRMFISRKYYNEIFKENNPYLLYALGNVISILNSNSSLLFETDTNVLSSFYNTKEEIYKILSKASNDIKLYEESFIFSRLSLELSAHLYSMKIMTNSNEHNHQLSQPFIMNYYIQNLKEVKINENNLISNTSFKDLLILNIIDVDNTSLYVIEHQDYKIVKSLSSISLSSFLDVKSTVLKNNNKYNINWVNNFKKYASVDSKRRYVCLDEQDINVLKYLDNVASDKDPSFNSFNKKKFTANVGELLYICFTISNPLNMDLPISSVKLIYNIIKTGDDNNNLTSNNNTSTCSVKQISNTKLILKARTKQQISLAISSEYPCIISIFGVEILIYKDIYIQHLFNKRKECILYNKKPNQNCIRSGSVSDLSGSFSRYTPEQSRETINRLRRRTRSNRSYTHVLQINKNKEISYELLSYNNNINITCPLGDFIECYKYQCFLYPIIIENNSVDFKIKKLSVFIYNNNSKSKILLTLKPFYTFNIRLNQNNPKVIIYIPIYCTNMGKHNIKAVIKFKDESKRRNIEIKRFSFQISIKESFCLDSFINMQMIKEKGNYKNLYMDYYVNINKISSQLTDLHMKDIYVGCDMTVKENYNKWNYDTIKGKCYKKLSLVMKNEQEYENKLKCMNSFSKQQSIIDDDIDPDAPNLNESLINISNPNDVISIYPELLKCLIENKSKLILTWVCNKIINDSKIQQITGFFYFDINESQNINHLKLIQTNMINPFNKIELNKSFLQNIVENICEVTPMFKSLPNDSTLIILQVKLHIKPLITFNDIISYDIFVTNNLNKTISALNWVGITKYTHLIEKTDNNYMINFICKTKLKGVISLNYIGLVFHFYTNKYKNLSEVIFRPKYIEINVSNVE